LTSNAVLAQTPPPAQPATLAIAEVTARGNVDADTANEMNDAMVAQLVADGRVKVVERQQIAKVMKEQALSQSGAMSDEVQIKLAQLVGARWIVIGSVQQKGRGYILGVRALDSSTAQVAYAENVKIGSDDQVEAGSKQLARKMTDKLLGPAAAGAQQASNDVVGDFDAGQVKDGARTVARWVALKFPKVTGKLVNVIPNGTTSCRLDGQAFPGQFFEVSALDDVTGQNTKKGYFLLSAYGDNGCSGRVKKDGGNPIVDGDTVTSMPIKISVEAVEAGPGTPPELAKLFQDEVRAALDAMPQFQVAQEPQVTATGRVTGPRGNRSIDMQVIDKNGVSLQKLSFKAGF
ncbi:MAG TPA: CsgG/HfaB family protein, partial [Myxococcales bacterium]|nr:CsgG/HfaB family protein [Myxococcales bacterium]